MKRLALLIAALAFILAACTAQGAGTATTTTTAAQMTTEAPASRKLTAEEAYARMTSGDPITILDVRTSGEYEEEHIDGAVLLPVETIGDEKPSELPVTDAEILIYCRSGNRSAQARALLEALGYTNVYDFGGINDWTYETVSGAYETKESSLASFRATSLDGAAVDESIWADNKLTMVNIWATFCGPCLTEMPDLGKLAAEYAAQDFGIVGIVIDTLDQNGDISMSQVEKARGLRESTGANYLHILPSDDLMNGVLQDVSSVPTTVFVDSEGNIVGNAYVGSRSADKWKAIVDALLAEVGS
ncbi:MAG: rhodanese-like domain-containing protein [Clostridiaceae bacterium]|nr:rhodanese-like domain-containing protein [Clostridiaceae bacterium]